MARRPRTEASGRWHHVFNRGARRSAIFLNDRDREEFLGLAGGACERFGVEVHAYCLLGNHFHVVLHCPERNLSDAMHWLLAVYVQRFNKRHGFDGPLFRSRYASCHIDDDAYFLSVVRYVHRNPVHHGLTDSHDSYRWSGHRAYTGDAPVPPWLERGMVMGLLATAGTDYRDWLDRDAEATELDDLECFDDEVIEGLGIVEIEDAVQKVFGVGLSGVSETRKGARNRAREMAILLATTLAAVPDASVASRYGLAGPSSVSSVRSRANARLGGDAGFRQRRDAVRSLLVS